MPRKTYKMEKLGIYVDGCPNKTDAKKAWEAKRDQWCERSTTCPPHAFSYGRIVCIVSPRVYDWEYTIIDTACHAGVRTPSCMYRAESQVKAIAAAVSAVAQWAWSRQDSDETSDAELFDRIAKAAGLRDGEAKSERSDFIYLGSRCRESVAVVTIED
jgi:hypothetical protein